MIPAYADALLRLLAGKPVTLDEARWRDLLAFADRTQCTLFLRHAPAVLPQIGEWIEAEICARRVRNLARRERLRAEYGEVSRALSKRGIEFVLLKGFTHEVNFGIDGEDRVQYDLDLLCAAKDAPAAQTILRELRYAPVGHRELSKVHERPLIRASTWTWRGDYYDPEMPIAVEIHTKLWDGASERIPLPELDQLWNKDAWSRRVTLEVAALSVPAMGEEDRVAFAALHCLRHILHNNLRLSHVWELARFLERRADDPRFWQSWTNAHSPRYRLLQALAMRFAAEWFACPLPPVIRELPAPVEQWFARCALSPIANLVEPNKDVIWLHKELVEGRGNRLALLWEHLIPLKAPQPGRSWERLSYHARALAPALWSGWRARKTASSSTSATSDWKRPSV